MTGEIRRGLAFKEAFDLSKENKVPMHPLYIYDYTDITIRELTELSDVTISRANRKNRRWDI